MTAGADATVESTVHRIFLDELEIDVGIETDVIEGGILDSMSFVRLLVALEDRFGVTVDVADLDLEDFGSIARIARFVSTRLDRGSTAGAVR